MWRMDMEKIHNPPLSTVSFARSISSQQDEMSKVRLPELAQFFKRLSGSTILFGCNYFPRRCIRLFQKFCPF